MVEAVNGYEATDDLPIEGEGYYAEAWSRRGPRTFKFLVLAVSPSKARGIVATRAARMMNTQTMDIDMYLEPLSSQEFVTRAREMIDRGIHLPDMITRFGGLRAYQESRPAFRQRSR